MKNPLLSPEAPRRREIVNWFCCSRFYKLDNVKSLILILLWQFSTGIFFNLFLAPTSFVQNGGSRTAIMFTIFLSMIFLFSPLAGNVADVKFDRTKVLICGTYVMLLSTTIFVIIYVLLAASLHTFNISGWTLLIVIFGSLVIYCIGAVLFLSNVIQFGTDQLRDAPTRYSVYFIYTYFWIDSISKLIARISYIPGNIVHIDIDDNVIKLYRNKSVYAGVMLCLSIVIIIIILIVVHKKRRKWFLSENNKENPYKLVYNVLHFAARHKKPIQRSAFTYCENECPSRLDFAKQRFGGPYTTEQVEDVKVLFNLLQLVLAYGPAFLLEISAAFSNINKIPYIFINKTHNPLISLLFDHSMVVPLSTVICIPLWLCVFKKLLSKYTPNLFKKVGIALRILTISFLLYLLIDFVAFDSNDDYNYHFNVCYNFSSKYKMNKNYTILPYIYLSLAQQLLFSFYQILLYTSAYELLSCQSPQHMKGILFGLFYALKALYQVIAAILLYAFTVYWKSEVMSCHTGYCIVNFIIGVASLIVYIIIARKYKYRKRDDICNIYKFAEDYYSIRN